MLIEKANKTINVLVYSSDMGSSFFEDWVLYSIDTNLCSVKDFLDSLAFAYAEDGLMDEVNDLSGIKEITNGYDVDIESEMEDRDYDTDGLTLKQMLKKLKFKVDEEYDLDDIRGESDYEEW